MRQGRGALGKDVTGHVASSTVAEIQAVSQIKILESTRDFSRGEKLKNWSQFS